MPKFAGLIDRVGDFFAMDTLRSIPMKDQPFVTG